MGLRLPIEGKNKQPSDREQGQVKLQPGCRSQHPPDFLPAQFLAPHAVSGLTTSASWGPAGCGMHELLSMKPFKLLLLLSKQVFIFHEVEQG